MDIRGDFVVFNTEVNILRWWLKKEFVIENIRKIRQKDINTYTFLLSLSLAIKSFLKVDQSKCVGASLKKPVLVWMQIIFARVIYPLAWEIFQDFACLGYRFQITFDIFERVDFWY